MSLQDNPFAVLGLSPRDDRRKAEEKAAQLNDPSAEEALAVLLDPDRRVRAELRWFPGTDPAAADAFLRYAKDLSDGDSTPMPPMDGLGCPLAQANALEAFFQAWPGSGPEYLAGLCRSMDRILSRVTVTETKNLINGDRRAGGWERIQDESAVAGQLETRIRELAQTIREKMERLETEESIRDALNSIMQSDADRQGAAVRAAAEAYSGRIRGREEELRTGLQARLAAQKDEKNTPEMIRALMPDVKEWCGMMEPLRLTDGPARDHANAICSDLRKCVASCFVNTPAVTEQKSGIYSTGGGLVSRTATYESKKAACREAIGFSVWLEGYFPEQSEILKTDQLRLEEIMKEEDRMVESRLAKGS